MAAKVFISHSHADKPWVDLIASQARSMGIVPYLAEHDVQAGRHLSDKIKTNIRTSDAVIVLLTTHGQSSVYVHQEVGAAVSMGKLVVPLVHPQVENESQGMLDEVEYIPFDFDHPNEGAEKLVAALKDIATRKQRDEIIQAVLVSAVIVGLIYVASQQA
jgi:TIR domain